MRRMCTITVLLLSRYFSFHTRSKISSEETTLPLFSQSSQTMSNSVGVRLMGSSYSVTVCCFWSMRRPLTAYTEPLSLAL